MYRHLSGPRPSLFLFAFLFAFLVVACATAVLHPASAQETIDGVEGIDIQNCHGYVAERLGWRPVGAAFGADDMAARLARQRVIIEGALPEGPAPIPAADQCEGQRVVGAILTVGPRGESLHHTFLLHTHEGATVALEIANPGEPIALIAVGQNWADYPSLKLADPRQGERLIVRFYCVPPAEGAPEGPPAVDVIIDADGRWHPPEEEDEAGQGDAEPVLIPTPTPDEGPEAEPAQPVGPAPTPSKDPVLDFTDPCAEIRAALDACGIDPCDEEQAAVDAAEADVAAGQGAVDAAQAALGDAEAAADAAAAEIDRLQRRAERMRDQLADFIQNTLGDDVVVGGAGMTPPDPAAYPNLTGWAAAGQIDGPAGPVGGIDEIVVWMSPTGVQTLSDLFDHPTYQQVEDWYWAARNDLQDRTDAQQAAAEAADAAADALEVAEGDLAAARAALAQARAALERCTEVNAAQRAQRLALERALEECEAAHADPHDDEDAGDVDEGGPEGGPSATPDSDGDGGGPACPEGAIQRTSNLPSVSREYVYWISGTTPPQLHSLQTQHGLDTAAQKHLVSALDVIATVLESAPSRDDIEEICEDPVGFLFDQLVSAVQDAMSEELAELIDLPADPVGDLIDVLGLPEDFDPVAQFIGYQAKATRAVGKALRTLIPDASDKAWVYWVEISLRRWQKPMHVQEIGYPALICVGGAWQPHTDYTHTTQPGACEQGAPEIVRYTFTNGIVGAEYGRIGRLVEKAVRRFTQREGLLIGECTGQTCR